MIFSSYAFIILSPKMLINPASTITSILFSIKTLSKALSKFSLLSKSFRRTIAVFILAFFALSSAYAFSLLLKTRLNCAFGKMPFSLALIIACKFVPPPLTKTAVFTTVSRPFRLFQFRLKYRRFLRRFAVKFAQLFAPRL